MSAWVNVFFHSHRTSLKASDDFSANPVLAEVSERHRA